MRIPQRLVVVLLGFFGLLFSFSLRTCFSLVMVYILRDNTFQANSLFSECTVNGTARDLTLPWDPSTTQYFNTVFFVGYFLTQIPGGYLSARFSSSRVFGLSALTSGSLMILLSFVMKYAKTVVYIIRFLQGLFEGMAIPALNGVLSAWSLTSEKSRMVTLTYCGAYLSPAVAFFITGATTCYISWHSSLFIFGGSTVLFSLAWGLLVYDHPLSNPKLSEQEKSLYEEMGSTKTESSIDTVRNVPYKQILTSLPVMAVFVGNFCRNWIFSMQVSQLPQYFSDAYNMDVASIGFLAAFPEVLMAAVVVIGGIIIDNLITSGKVSTTAARKIAQCTGFGIESLCLLGLYLINDYRLATVFLLIGVGFSGMAISGYQVNPLDLAPQYAHIVTGFTRTSCIGSVLSTVLAGAIRQKNIESWQTIFVVAGSVHLFGVIFYGVFASGERQSWATDMSTSESLRTLTAHPEYGTVTDTPKGHVDRIPN
ncbi:vesicular glutamate transporter 1-like [Crassostrea virginica]|uniref:Vesicular glutamate transporter 1-like n=1 Tax=Crassostrea virginica TaxID=6565 RepID=A0A8B8DGA9_CRAVI|nr:vesicular glutamate transporter 1-like [Crassostrea virginica]